MNLTDFDRQGINLDRLMRSVKAGRIAHALLLTGPHGTGKKTAAQLVAQALVCESDDAPCGICPACKRFLAGSYQDLHVIPGEERSISVDEIRELRDQLALRPFEGKRHIAMIRNADRMTAQAQNALLKTLEEPVGDCVFFLITDQPGAMLSTILSRCRQVRFSPLTVEDCAQVLVKRGMDRERADLLAGCAQGCVGRALEIDADESYLPLREKVLASLAELEGGRASVAKAISQLGDVSKNAANALEIMEVAARDRMMLDNGRGPYAAQRRMKLDGRALLLGVMQARRMAASNVSLSGALEKMYLNLAEQRL